MLKIILQSHKLAKATARHDLADLVQKEALVKTEELGYARY